MGKRGKASRKRRRENDVLPATIVSKILENSIHTRTEESPSDDEYLHGISDEALGTTIATLHRLCGLEDSASGKPAIKDKRYRSLRRELYDLQKSLGVQSSATSFGNNGVASVLRCSSSKITNDISEQIERGAWDTAVATLRNLRQNQEILYGNQCSTESSNNTSKSGISPSYFCYRPKLGSLQRWVREIDAAGTSDPLALEVLDAILRVVASEVLIPVTDADLSRATWAKLGVGMGIGEDADTNTQRGRIRLFPAFRCKVSDENSGGQEEKCNLLDSHVERQTNDVFDKLVSIMVCGSDGIRRISNSNSPVVRDECFRVCGHEDGPDRKPPNKYSLDLLTTSVVREKKLVNSNEEYTTISSCDILVRREPTDVPIIKTPIPYVHNTFLLQNVLSHSECDRLIAAAEMAGYCPDEPLAGQPGASILAHACVWVVDHKMERTIFERVKEFLPSYTQLQSRQSEKERDEDELETLNPLGINRRFRFYRYVPGRYYRPHIDGAWPSSGFDDNGEYRYDINDIENKNGVQFVQPGNSAKEGKAVEFPESATSEGHEGIDSAPRRQLSRLTFLIYLNDDFDGGHTTFLIPAKEREGVLNAFPVKPVRGCVLVFPHGSCAAPLHEGSPVLKRCKYVVRTEVEYYV
ncbi:hypothetical protein HJC23_011388 [Cyclotella cryptica]|uniref:Fe2OG dioxygenase domain-containing protein n=1 Tax=Cyclotella cryptica TaxID=29204 RepID=A0ABD3PQ30_9STRA|eukprot:CCRYP_012709-RA/>CCRYP_012709-RA protein AED:0.16 eAED:0.16 QI:176/1/1/1/1/1/2/1561/638